MPIDYDTDYGAIERTNHEKFIFSGNIKLPDYCTDVVLVPNDKRSSNAPDFRIMAKKDGIKQGVAWIKTRKETSEEFLTITLERLGADTTYCSAWLKPSGKYEISWKKEPENKSGSNDNEVPL